MPGPLPDPHARDRILDAADALLARAGYADMTIAAVAAAAGVGKGSVYLHVDSKQTLAVACIARNAERVAARLERIARSARPVPARLREMLRARVLLRFDYARAHAASLDALLAAVRPALLASRAQQFGAEAAIVARVLREGQRDGTVRRGDARAFADACVTATNALLPFSLSTHELGRRADVARRAGALAAVLLDGICPAHERRSR